MPQSDFLPIPTDNQKQKAGLAYVMSLVGLMVGLPLPILNLLATGIFYLDVRRNALFVRWHATQALFSQVLMVAMNSVGFYWTIGVLFRDFDVTNSYVTYLFTIGTFNLLEFAATLYAAIQVRKGFHVKFFLFGPITDLLVLGSVGRLKQILLHLLAAIILFFGLWRALDLIPFVSHNEVLEFTWQQEERLGQLVLEGLEDELIEDDDFNAFADMIISRLSLDEGVSIHLIDSKSPNAFVIPGKHILIHSGIIRYCDTPEQLAAIIAHEWIHVRERHVMTRLGKEIGIAVLAGMLGQDHISGGAIAERILGMSGKAFDRSQEQEADDGAAELLFQAGIPPEALAQVLEKFDDQFEIAWLGTHPSTEDRVRRIRDRYPGSNKTAEPPLGLSGWNKWKVQYDQ